MKFDAIVMNPPFRRNLHIRILAEALKHLKDEKSVCVNLSPVRWLQDPLARYKKASDLKRFEESVAKHIESIELITTNEASTVFNIVAPGDLGLYSCKSKDFGRVPDMEIWPFSKKSFDWIVSHNPTYDKDKKDGWRVRFPIMLGPGAGTCKRGAAPALVNFGKLFAFKDGRHLDGRWWYECYSRNQHSKTTETLPNSIAFASKDEAENFISSLSTDFGRYVTDILAGHISTGPEVVLWLSSATNPRTGLVGYKGEWTDEDLFQFFGLTDEEQKVIEETMAKYK